MLKLKKYEILLISVLVVCSFFFRFYNLKEWKTEEFDETHNLTFVETFNSSQCQNLHSCVTLSTQYWPTTLLGWVKDVYQGRLFIACLSFCGIIFSYLLLAEITKDYKISFLLSFLLSISSYILYISRSFFVDWSDMVVPIIATYLIVLWTKNKKPIYLLITSFILGIGLINHAVIIYFIVSLVFYLLYRTVVKNEFQFHTMVFLFIVFSFFIFHIGATFNTTPEHWYKFRYELFNEPWTGNLVLINLKHFDEFSARLYKIIFPDYRTFLPSINIMPIHRSVLVYFILLVPFIVFLKNYFSKRRSETIVIMFFLSYVNLFLVLMSPIPAYDESHFLPFFVSFIFLIGSEFYLENHKFLKFCLLGIVFMLIFFNIFSAAWIITRHNYVSNIKSILLT